MKKKYFVISLFLIFIFSLNTKAQYNFFVGNDAGQLKTTVKGFGSISFPSIMVNQSFIGTSSGNFKPFFSVNVGFNWKQWRFADDKALIKDNNGVIVVQNAPVGEDYTDGFFSYTKTKLSTGVVRLRPEFGFTTHNGNFSIGTGPLIEFMVAAKHKRKYYNDGSKEKNIKKGIDYYNLKWFQFGWGASVGTFHFGVFTYFMFTPMFDKNMGPNVKAAEVGLYWRIQKGVHTPATFDKISSLY